MQGRLRCRWRRWGADGPRSARWADCSDSEAEKIREARCRRRHRRRRRRCLSISDGCIIWAWTLSATSTATSGFSSSAASTSRCTSETPTRTPALWAPLLLPPPYSIPNYSTKLQITNVFFFNLLILRSISICFGAETDSERRCGPHTHAGGGRASEGLLWRKSSSV